MIGAAGEKKKGARMYGYVQRGNTTLTGGKKKWCPHGVGGLIDHEN